ncbi:nucleoside-triphosphatase [Petrotoga sp. 9PWA.NaAc.5.4]|uniref:nucleoside-triphosphatase n=1 Tax=Petrotoga sp. 9PWA.NaAc.5.4 TaxID=1434328 RepID=UPI000CC59A17|nr:nucleoside-triphosphatase [Petrotoga sp. 9PWA.NaAc.5.4]PNR96662.1 ATP-binding protein [Petrotoga sp. 9PWA.NaAc.5.4]
MYKKNIFLTGKPGVGKSKIINKLVSELNLKIGGFEVIRDGDKNAWTSFYLVEVSQINKSFNSLKSEINRFAFRKDINSKWEINIEVFNKLGVNFLSNLEDRDIVIMDELGRFELKAYDFQKKIEEVLSDDKVVLGVIKDESNEFLDRIRNRKDVEILRVTQENREVIYQKTKTLLISFIFKG